MNPATSRLNYLGHSPSIELQLTPPASDSATLADLNLQAPSMFAPLVRHVRWDWMFDVSCHLAGQFRRLGMSCAGKLGSTDGTGLLVDDVNAMTPMAAAHAWMIGLAQRSAMEIRQLEQLDEQRNYMTPDVVEITTVALLAGTTNPRGSSRRLSDQLRLVAEALATLCQNEGVQAQFVFSRPMSTVSPITQQHAVPLSACRVRAIGITAPRLVEILKKALQTPTPTGELLVMSNVWLTE